MTGYRSVSVPGEREFTINRSRFIGRCWPVETEEEALAILADIKKRHWDATHNCYAYRIGPSASVARYSDDGEPGGTAGLPIMEVLTAKGLTNVLCIVTRYFGGILLGAGGLVRAYSRGAAEAVKTAGTVSFSPAVKLELAVDYSRYGAIEAYVHSAAQVDDVVFGENVRLFVTVAQDRAPAFSHEIVQRTDGRCTPERTGESLLKAVEL